MVEERFFMFNFNGSVEMNEYGYFIVEVRTGKKKAVTAMLRHQNFTQVFEVAEEFRKDFVNYLVVQMFASPECINQILRISHVKNILGKLSPEEVNRLIPNPQAFAA